MQKQPNIAVVISHDLGRYLRCYGQPDARTPHIDALAAESHRFANNFCTAPQCSPSRAALWTGRFPHANGVVGLTHGGFANELNPGERHLAQHLRAAGYAAHVFGYQHESQSQERCGFEFAHEQRHSSGPEVARSFGRFLAEPRTDDRPFFAEICCFEPHRAFPRDPDITPLDPASLTIPAYLPDIPVVREDLAALEASAATLDRAVGIVREALDASPDAADTILIFTADHGIAFPRAKMTLYDPGIETPLLVRIPGQPGGKVHKDMISNVDIAPAQETSPDYLNNGKGYPEVSIAWNLPYSRAYHPPIELYDLQADPDEQNDLADDPQHRDIRDGLISRLREWMETTGDPLLDGPIPSGAYRQRMQAFKEI